MQIKVGRQKRTVMINYWSITLIKLIIASLISRKVTKNAWIKLDLVFNTNICTSSLKLREVIYVFRKVEYETGIYDRF